MSLQSLADMLGRVNGAVGKAAAWLMLPLVLVMLAIVILRYFFGTGWISLQEVVVYLHASSFMLALAWTLQDDQHVRVDIFYRNFSPRRRAVVNLLGTLLFLVPMALLLLLNGIDYAGKSWRVLEGSREAGGLPFLYLLKSVMPVAAALLLLQGVVMIARSILKLREPN